MCATGLSAAGADLAKLADKATICVNDAWRHVPNPKFATAFDDHIIKTRQYDYPKATYVFSKGAGLDWIEARGHQRCCEVELQCSTQKALQNNSRRVVWNRKNSVAGALWIAWRLGFDRAIILGLDGYRTSDAYYLDGTKHHRGDRDPARIVDGGRILEKRHLEWVANFDEFASVLWSQKAFPRGVVNLSEHSSITAFPRRPIPSWLQKNP